jgi:hypothetical protein
MMGRFIQGAAHFARRRKRANSSTPGITGTGTMTDFEAQVLSDLSVLKNQMITLVGDGNAGRIGSIEQRVTQHEERFQSARGFALAIGGLITLIQFVVDFLRRK